MPASQRPLVPAQEARVEVRVQNSRFIASAAPAFSVKQAQAFITRIRREFPDATHHVPAYLIGHGATVIAHCHDDGEPSGTAGRPALTVLQGSGLGDVVVVVTRYFGGTRLGTGGLVRAYSEAVRQVLALLPRAVKVPAHTVRIETPYPLFERVRHAIESHGGQVTAQEFDAQVRLTVLLPVELFAAFQEALQALSDGSVQAQIIPTDETPQYLLQNPS
ncbi:MAG: IMPACT family protein [Anaerolineae bacterium]